MRETVPAIATAQLTGAERILPFRASSARDAAGASKLVQGYFDRRGGKLHFEILIEDADTHRMQPLSVEGEALAVADRIAKAMDAAAAPFATQNAAAVQAWGERDPERATQIDPNFGPAWREWILTQGTAPEMASAIATRALARPGLRSALDRAQISLVAAELRQEPAEVRKSLSELVRLLPRDAGLARRLAGVETNARNFQAAVELYRTVLRLEPEDSASHNLLGYAQFFAGDLAAALKSFEEYGRYPGQAANALDSQGEVLFMAGRFREAEPLFQRAHQMSPGLLQGGDLQKAAVARWLSGDLKGADAVFDQYLKYRLDHADPNTVARREVWLFSTGRTAQKRDPLPDSVEALEKEYLRTPPAADDWVRILYARALIGAGRRVEAGKLLERWPLPEPGPPLLYPVYLELKKDLGK